MRHAFAYHDPRLGASHSLCTLYASHNFYFSQTRRQPDNYNISTSKTFSKNMKFSIFTRFFSNKRSQKKIHRAQYPSEATITTQDDNAENSCNENDSIVISSNEQESVSSYQNQEESRQYGMNRSLDTATRLNDLGVTFQKTGLRVSAENDGSSVNSNEIASAAYRASLKIKRKQFGNSHPSVATTLNNLGSIYYSEGDVYRALDYYNESLNIMTRHFGPDNVNVATIWHNIGDVYRAMNKSGIALICFQQALNIRQKCMHKDDVRVIRLIEKINKLLWKKELALLRIDIVEEINKINELENEFKNEIQTIFTNIKML